MTLEERAILESGIEWDAERVSDPDADEDTPTGNSTLNLNELAALGADVSEES